MGSIKELSQLVDAQEWLDLHAPLGSSVVQRIQARISFGSKLVDAINWSEVREYLSELSEEDCVEKFVELARFSCVSIKDEIATGFISGLMVLKKLEKLINDPGVDFYTSKEILRLSSASFSALGVTYISSQHALKFKETSRNMVLVELSKKCLQKIDALDLKTDEGLANASFWYGLGSSIPSSCLHTTRQTCMDVLLSVINSESTNPKQELADVIKVLETVLPPGLESVHNLLTEHAAFWLLSDKSANRSDWLSDFSQSARGESLLAFLPCDPEEIANSLVKNLIELMKKMKNEADVHAHLKTVVPEALVVLAGEHSAAAECFLNALDKRGVGKLLLFASGYHHDPLSVAQEIKAHQGSNRVSGSSEDILVDSVVKYLKPMAVALVESTEITQAMSVSDKAKRSSRM